MRLTALAIVTLFMSAPAIGQDTSTFERLGKQYTDAFNKGDAAAVAALYADEVFLLPPGAPIIKGRANVQSYMAQAVNVGGDFKLVTVDVKPLGPDTAREVGTFSFKLKGAQSQEVVGKYIIVWEKIGSDWKLATDIWNMDK
jgi:uncharacterized protein (TIGR02246 family)